MIAVLSLLASAAGCCAFWQWPNFCSITLSAIAICLAAMLAHACSLPEALTSTATRSQ